jgi:Spy/CpxP family protein refolding chaperone
MKKFLSILIALVILTLTASAQSDGNRHPRPTPEQITDRMAEQLSLTDAQKSQVLALNTEYQDVIGGPGFGHGRPGGGPHGQHGQHNNSDGESGATDNSNANHHQRPELTEEQKAKFEEMRAKRDEYNIKLKSILTADQYAKYEDSQKRGPHGNNGHHNGQKGNKDKKN